MHWQNQAPPRQLRTIKANGHRAKCSPGSWLHIYNIKENGPPPVSHSILSFCLETRFSQILHKQFNYAGTASTARKQRENIKKKSNFPDVFKMFASNVWNHMWTFDLSGMFGIWCELNICRVRNIWYLVWTEHLACQGDADVSLSYSARLPCLFCPGDTILWSEKCAYCAGYVLWENVFGYGSNIE